VAYPEPELLASCSMKDDISVSLVSVTMCLTFILGRKHRNNPDEIGAMRLGYKINDQKPSRLLSSQVLGNDLPSCLIDSSLLYYVVGSP